VGAVLHCVRELHTIEEAVSPGSEQTAIEQPMDDSRGAMISRPPQENRGRRRRLGFGGSLAVHVLAALLFVLLAPLFPKPETETQSSSPEVVTVTHRPKHPPAPRRAAVAPAPRSAPAPVAAVRPHPRPQRAPPVAARVPRVLAAPALPRIVRHPVRPEAVPAAPQAAAVATPGRAARPSYSKARIESIENDLAKSIAAQRNGIAPLAVGTSEPAPEIKRFGPAIAAFDVGDERTHHGLCDPIKAWNADGFDYYYVACNVRFSDGTMQRESVPWPVRFEPNNDPFSGTAGRDLPLAMPLPGWHLESGVYISKELREYAHDHGINI